MNDKLKEQLAELIGKPTEEQKQEIIKGLRQASQQWLTDKEFHDTFDFGKKMATEEAADGITMQFWLYGTNYDHKAPEKDQKVIMPVMLMDWPPPENVMTKEQAMMGIGAQFADHFKDHMLVNILHVSEAWVVQRPKDAPEEDMNIAPSESPHRVEVAMVSLLSIDRRQALWHGKIIRDKEGNFTRLRTLMVKPYKPSEPFDPEAQRNYLAEAIYAGYNRAKGVGGNKDGTPK